MYHDATAMVGILVAATQPPNNNNNNKGIPVGIVRMAPQHVAPFRRLLDETLDTQPRFRGVDKEPNGLLTIHLAPIAAAAMDAKEPQLTHFLEWVGAEYVPGVRRNKYPHLWGDHHHHHPTKKKKKKQRQPHKLLHNNNNNNSESFTFVELFAGIGGFRLGLEAIGGICTLANEWNPHAAAIYKNYFENNNGLGNNDNDDESISIPSLVEGDVLDLESAFLGDFDMLTAGFPCQPFSSRGLQPGLEDERGQLYLELVRMLHDQRPPCFLFENVAGLVTIDGGSRTKKGTGGRVSFTAGSVLERILDAFRSCGYNVDWRVINSRRFLPQQRERVYIVGTRDDFDCDLLDWDGIAEGGLLDSKVRDILEPKESAAVMASELTPTEWSRVQAVHVKRNRNPFTDGRIDLDGKTPTLISSMYRRVVSSSTKFVFEEADGTIRDGKGTNRRPRFLTPRECCRVMGFPEDYVVPSPSDGEETIANFYRGIGNAVTPPVISAIGKDLMRCVRESKNC